METTIYTIVGLVLQLNKNEELTQKRMEAVKVCDGLYISKPDKTQFVKMIIEYNGIMWVESTKHAALVIPEELEKRMPEVLKSIENGKLAELDEYRQEINRRIFNQDSPAIMELKKPKRKKPIPLAENERKVRVLMYDAYDIDVFFEKKVVITEFVPHVYIYAHKNKSRLVKIIFDIDGVYFMEGEFGANIYKITEKCTETYAHARELIADISAKSMTIFIEIQKRIDAVIHRL